MCLHSVLNLSPVERVKKCRFSNTNKNQNCTKIALGKNTILLGFGYSALTFMSKGPPRAWQRVPRIQTWAEDYPQTRPYHGKRQGALLV